MIDKEFLMPISCGKNHRQYGLTKFCHVNIYHQVPIRFQDEFYSSHSYQDHKKICKIFYYMLYSQIFFFLHPAQLQY